MAYESAKGGILALTRSLAVDYGPHGIRTNTLSPGFILSERAVDWMIGGPRREEAMRIGIPLRRPGQPAEIDGRYFLGSVDVVTVVVAKALPQ